MRNLAKILKDLDVIRKQLEAFTTTTNKTITNEKANNQKNFGKIYEEIAKVQGKIQEEKKLKA